jgi:hypothetical protein
MELTPATWLVLIIVAFILGLILGDRTQLPSRVMNGVLATRAQATMLETHPVSADGGTIHFIDPANQIDVTVTVPRQTSPRTLVFQRLTPTQGLSNPTGKKIYNNFMGLGVTDDKGNPVTYFDPAITIKKTYSDELLKQYMEKFKVNKDLSNLILVFHDGEAWRRLPITDRNPIAKTLTALIGSFVHSDNLADCG